MSHTHTYNKVMSGSVTHKLAYMSCSDEAALIIVLAFAAGRNA